MPPGADKLDDLNAIDDAWAELGREIDEAKARPPADELPKVNVAEPPDPEIEAMIAGLDLLDDQTATAPPPPSPVPAAAPTPAPVKAPSRSLMPPYVPPLRPPSRPSAPATPERPTRPPSRPALTPPSGPARTLLAFGAPFTGGGAPSAAETPPEFPAPQTPVPGREPVPTPVVTILDADTGEVQSPALTLDLDEMDRGATPSGGGPRKPSAPRVPIDLSDFDASVRPEGRGAPSITAPPPEQEPQIPAGPPAVPDVRRGSPTPDEVVTTPLPLAEAVGFERELDLPVVPGVAKQFDLETQDELDALGAVERAAEPESIVARMEREMHERFDTGDFSAALELAEWLLRDLPGHEQAKRYAKSCREVLLQMYAARLGSLDRVPSIVVGATDLKHLGLDHRAGFVLSCIDGNTTFAEILDLAGMPPLESYRILCDLILAHVIAVR